jgi:uncharacterized protein (TIGR02599 family)
MDCTAIPSRIMHPAKYYKNVSQRGFTLFEILVATTISIVLVAIISQITSSVIKTTASTSSKIDAFAAARLGFNLLNQRLSKATLNTFWAYDDSLNPTVYLRQSDLQFTIRPNQQNSGYGQEVYLVAPETYSGSSSLRSVSGLLNACSFFVQYGDNQTFRASTETGSRFRYRLMQGFQPTESRAVFNNFYTTGSQGWITDIVNNGGNPVTSGSWVSPLADNVIALLFWPRVSKADDSTGTRLTGSSNAYAYDSRSNATATTQPITANQLPPVVQITMVMISEASAQRLDTHSSTPPAAVEAALNGKFTDVTKYDADLVKMESILVQNHIAYQVFTTAVPLKESKWSDSAQ